MPLAFASAFRKDDNKAYLIESQSKRLGKSKSSLIWSKKKPAQSGLYRKWPEILKLTVTGAVSYASDQLEGI